MGECQVSGLPGGPAHGPPPMRMLRPQARTCDVIRDAGAHQQLRKLIAEVVAVEGKGGIGRDGEGQDMAWCSDQWQSEARGADKSGW